MRAKPSQGRAPSRFALAALLTAAVVVAPGCNNAGEGALTGAGIGALGGLVIGSLYGQAGTGAAIGAVAGGAAGAVIGDQNERHDWNTPRYEDDW